MNKFKKPAIFFGTLCLVAGMAGCLGGGGGGGSSASTNSPSPSPSPAPSPAPSPSPAPAPAPSPTTQFAISGTTPANAASGLSVATDIQVNFTGAVDSASIFHNTQTTYDPKNPGVDNFILTSNKNPTVPLAISVDFPSAQNNTLSVRPSIDLRINSTYTLTILHTLKDTSGQTLSGDKQVSFVTGNAPGSNPATLTITITEAAYPVNQFELGSFHAFWGVTSGIPSGSSTLTPPNSFIYDVADHILTLDSSTPAVTLPVQSLANDTRFKSTLNLDALNFLPGQTYFFAVKACNTSVCSIYSPEATFRVE